MRMTANDTPGTNRYSQRGIDIKTTTIYKDFAHTRVMPDVTGQLLYCPVTRGMLSDDGQFLLAVEKSLWTMLTIAEEENY